MFCRADWNHLQMAFRRLSANSSKHTQRRFWLCVASLDVMQDPMSRAESNTGSAYCGAMKEYWVETLVQFNISSSSFFNETLTISRKLLFLLRAQFNVRMWRKTTKQLFQWITTSTTRSSCVQTARRRFKLHLAHSAACFAAGSNAGAGWHSVDLCSAVPTRLRPAPNYTVRWHQRSRGISGPRRSHCGQGRRMISFGFHWWSRRQEGGT